MQPKGERVNSIKSQRRHNTPRIVGRANRRKNINNANIFAVTKNLGPLRLVDDGGQGLPSSFHVARRDSLVWSGDVYAFDELTLCVGAARLRSQNLQSTTRQRTKSSAARVGFGIMFCFWGAQTRRKT